MTHTILTLSHLTCTCPGAAEPLFEDLTCAFPPGWTALVGDNGIGKTTLTRLVTGALSPDSGQISPAPGSLVAAVCPQSVTESPASLDEFAADWSPEIIAVRDALRIGDDWCWRYDSLSGGEAKRLQIACALAARPDVLILDEPTNHVDAPACEAIIAGLKRFRGIGVLVSHDVDLADALCTRTVALERHHVGTRNVTVVVTYAGGLTAAMAQREARDSRAQGELDAARSETARLRAVKAQRFAQVQRIEAGKRKDGFRIDRRDHDARGRRKLAKATGLDAGATGAYTQLDGRIAAAQARQSGIVTAAKRYDGDIWMDARPSRRAELIRLSAGLFRFDGTLANETDAPRSLLRDDAAGHWHICTAAGEYAGAGTGKGEGDTVAGLSGDGLVSDGVGDGVGVRIPALSVGPRDHIALTGPNGSGKSTVLAALLEAAPADVPALVIRQETDQADARRALEELDGLPPQAKARALGAIARLNADPDRLMVGGSPSPGELRKLLLALGVARGAQLIVMDEPTNHLDLTSKAALARLLADCPVAWVIASHDDWFLSRALGQR